MEIDVKYLAWIGGIVISLVVVIYVVAFTSIGNSMIAPIIEKKIKQQIKQDVKLNVFSLSMSDFEIALEISKNNTIYVKGNYALLSQAFNVAYRVKFNNLEALQTLAQAPIRGEFFTEGTAKGTLALLTIDGVSDVAKSDTKYHVELVNLEPKQVIATINKAKVNRLLYMVSQPDFASADLDLNINLTSLKLENLAGEIEARLNNGLINSTIMKEKYRVNIPRTIFSSKTTLRLKAQDINYNTWFKSNLANIGSSGNIVPKTLAMDILYALDIKELAVLKPITKADLRGALNLKGTLKGDKKNLIVNAKSNLASSNTSFKVTLKNFEPLNAQVNIKDLKLQELLYMMHQPVYASGLFSLDANIADARVGKLKGKVNTKITNGLFNSKFLTKLYEFKSPMPKATFKLATVSNLNANLVDTKVDLDSTFANIDAKQARVNLNDLSIKSDYSAVIANLDKLFFATQRHLKGGITLNGDLVKAKDLDLSVFSKVAGGTIKVNLHNDELDAKIKSVQTLDVLDMLIYPKIFKASLEGSLKYNIAKNKGKFSGFLLDGKFAKNQMLSLIRHYGKVDLYKEVFKGSVNADINAHMIKASLNLRSNTSSITTKDTKLNSKTNVIDSVVTVVANKHPVTVKIKGKATSAKVSVDTKKLIESKTGEAIEKGISKLLKKFF